MEKRTTEFFPGCGLAEAIDESASSEVRRLQMKKREHEIMR
jgi:hypothetical protein